ncbi:MAG: hypothetical protein HHJ12_18590 [Glaciimonas sp.]|nr:hypothetical protein [Glaciimonas sp.]
MTKTASARLVLQDVVFVRNKLETEVGHIEWRLYWILAVVFLRSVGHVLDKVDGSNDLDLKKEANALFKSWQIGNEHEIFRSFIDCERNSILKEYESDMSEGPVPVLINLKNKAGCDVIQQVLIEENIYRPMTSGVYEGEDGRTLIDEAISWWESQLDKLDRVDAGQPG